MTAVYPSLPNSWARLMIYNCFLETSRNRPKCVIGIIQHIASLPSQLWALPSIYLTTTATSTAQTDSQALQNAQMMYECLMGSIMDEAKSTLALSDLDFYEDGPKLSNAQMTRDQLSDF